MKGIMGQQNSCSWDAFDHASHAPQLRSCNYYMLADSCEINLLIGNAVRKIKISGLVDTMNNIEVTSPTHLSVCLSVCHSLSPSSLSHSKYTNELMVDRDS